MTAVKHRYGSILKEEIDITDFIVFFNKFIKQDTNKWQMKVNCYTWIPLFKIVFALALYFNDSELFELCNSKLNSEMNRWKHININFNDIDIFKCYPDVSIKKKFFPYPHGVLSYSDLKIQDIKNEILKHFINKSDFFNNIDINCNNPKFKRLNTAKIINVNLYNFQNLF